MAPVVASIEATAASASELLQIPPVTLLLKADAAPVQILLIPAMVPASGRPELTVMICDAKTFPQLLTTV